MITDLGIGIRGDNAIHIQLRCCHVSSMTIFRQNKSQNLRKPHFKNVTLLHIACNNVIYYICYIVHVIYYRF